MGDEIALPRHDVPWIKFFGKILAIRFVVFQEQSLDLIEKEAIEVYGEFLRLHLVKGEPASQRVVDAADAAVCGVHGSYDVEILRDGKFGL